MSKRVDNDIPRIAKREVLFNNISEVNMGLNLKRKNDYLFFIAGIELLNSLSRSAGNIMIV